MLRKAPLILCLSLTVAGCDRMAESRLNPLNWFGGSSVVASDPANRQPLVSAAQRAAVQDLRVPIDQIIALEILRTPTGALVRATGEAQSQGYFNAELVLLSVANGDATYEFRVEAPEVFAGGGTAATRRIVAVTTMEQGLLASINRVTVQGARNARTASR